MAGRTGSAPEFYEAIANKLPPLCMLQFARFRVVLQRSTRANLSLCLPIFPGLTDRPWYPQPHMEAMQGYKRQMPATHATSALPTIV
jgi:hypothetical protein